MRRNSVIIPSTSSLFLFRWLFTVICLLLLLMYFGSQLSDGHSLFDYDVGLKDVIQILVRQPLEEMVDEKESSPKSSSEEKMGTVSSVRSSNAV